MGRTEDDRGELEQDLAQVSTFHSGLPEGRRRPHAPSAASTPPLSISVVGNHFVNGARQFMRLLGVNWEGTEYACAQGTTWRRWRPPGWGSESYPAAPGRPAARAVRRGPGGSGTSGRW